MTFRAYDPERDKESAKRIWHETGWIDADKPEALDLLISAGTAVVADIRGEAECLVMTAMGELRYHEEKIPLSGVHGVTTSRVGRRQGLAGGLTAHAVALDAAQGAMLSALCIFDQGFYDRLGFGCGVQEIWHNLDPMSLRIDRRPDPPHRIEKDHWAPAHASRLTRMKGHGSASFFPAETSRAEMVRGKNSFGLGYFDGEEITHHVWLIPFGTHGPHRVEWMAYRNTDQLLELLALLRDLGDQVYEIKMRQPPQIQLQDLVDRPIRRIDVSEKARCERKAEALAYWQLRICDLAGCLGMTHLLCDPVRFNLELRDPIECYLTESAPWRGIGGNTIVTLGPESGAVPGQDPSLPTLKAGTGAFTRLWMGILPATSLSVTDELEAPPNLLASLDRALASLPGPHLDWDF